MNFKIFPYQIDYFAESDFPFISHFWPRNAYLIDYDKHYLELQSNDLYLDVYNLLKYKKIKVLFKVSELSKGEIIAKVYIKENFNSGILRTYDLRNAVELPIDISDLQSQFLLIFHFDKVNEKISNISLEFK